MSCSDLHYYMAPLFFVHQLKIKIQTKKMAVCKLKYSTIRIFTTSNHTYTLTTKTTKKM